MKIKSITVICLFPAFGFAQGLERSVRPIFDPARELQAMQMVPVCPENVPVGVKNGRFICLTNFANDDLALGQHSSVQCTKLGGEVLTDGDDKFCRFSGNSCPSGWEQFKKWASYAHQRPKGGCETSAKGWGNGDAPTCSDWCGEGCRQGNTSYAIWSTAVPYQVGCY